jgi:cation/acetate symporter
MGVDGLEPMAAAAGVGLAVVLALLGRAFSGMRSDPTAGQHDLALAAEVISAPFFLCAAGAVFAWGPDGLGFVLGLGAGLLLLQLLVSPYLPATGARSVPEYIGVRYASATARALASLAVIVSMMVLLIAQLMAAGLVTARLLALEPEAAIAAAAAAVLVCFMLRGMTGASAVRGIVFLVMLAALLTPAVMFSLHWLQQAVPQLAYADALQRVQDLELTLLENELADPAVMAPMLRPFLTLDPMNLLGLILGLAVGTAALPNVFTEQAATANARKARRSVFWAIVIGGVLLTAMPAVAAFAKLALLTLIAGNTTPEALPAWVFAYGKLGLVEVCGIAATDAAAVAKACAAAPDWAGVVRLQDMVLDPDMIVLALPEIAGQRLELFGALAAAGLAAALVTADGPLAAIVSALGFEREPATAKRRVRFAPYLIAACALAAAAFAATTRPAGILTLATWAFTLAAAGLFPALVAGLWWRRASAAAAAAAIVAGLGVSVFYLVGTRYFAVPFFETWPTLSSAGPTAREIFGVLQQAWAAAQPGPSKAAAFAALDAHAQTMADWWGIRPLASALIALPAGLAVMIVVAIFVPARRSPQV